LNKSITFLNETLLSRKGVVAILRGKIVACPKAAQGIGAEILFCRFAAKKIGADSPVFACLARKNAPITDFKK
jgi:hypothetical protein